MGLVLLGLAGIGEILAGLAPENANATLHVVGARLGIPAENLGVLLLGLAIWRTRPWEGASAALSAGLGLFGFFVAPVLGVPIGAAERLAAYPSAVWLIAIGSLVLAPAAGATRQSPSVTRSHRQR